MLILSFTREESLMVGDVEVKVVQIKGSKVKLGITAPKSVPIHRRKIYDAIQREREQGQ